MKAIVCLIVFSVVMAAVCGAPWGGEEEGEALLTAQDFYEYFEVENMDMANRAADATLVEKRARRKAGPCKTPSGLQCQLCNLRIKNKNNMKRYVLCGGSSALIHGI